MSTPLHSAARRLRRWLGHSAKVQALPGETGQFVLEYHDLVVGHLDRTVDRWIFRYSDAFRERDDLRPLANFPDTTKVYESEELWPFFSMRIPDTRQDAVQKIARKHDLDPTSQVQLLRQFGRRSIANPYELEGVD